jgi:RNA polymerase sigma-70 factor, ECF subfamily
MVDVEIVERALLSHRVQLLGYIGSIVRDYHLAEDIFQDVAVLAIQKAAEIEDAAHLYRWFRRTARYRASNAMRNRYQQPQLLGDDVLDVLDRSWEEFDLSSSAEMLAAIPLCLKQLSLYARKLIKYRFVDGLTGRQISDKLDREVNAVYVAMTRAYRKLDECIRQALLQGQTKHGKPA